MSRKMVCCRGRNCSSPGSVLVAVCACSSLSIILTVAVCLNALFNDWTTSFHTNRGHTATVQSTCFGVMLGGGLLAALLERKLGARKSLMLGSVLATAGLFSSGFASNLDVLIVTVGVVAGSGFGLLHLSILSSTVTRFSSHSGIISASIATVTGLLHLGTPILFRYLSDLYTWRGCLFVVAGLIFQTVVPGIIITSPIFSSPKPPEQRRDTKNACEKSTPLITKDEYQVEYAGNGTVECHRHQKCPQTEENTTLLISSTAPSHDEDLKTLPENECTNGHVLGTEFSALKLPTGNNEESIAKLDKDASKLISLDTEPFESTLCKSRWSFLKSPLYLWLVATLVIPLSTLISLIFLVLDFATSNGWTVEDGLFFNFCFMLGSLIGRAVVGLASLHRNSSSIILVAIGCITGAAGIAPLGYVSSYELIAGQMVLMGLSYGALSGIYPSAVLQAAGVHSYSLALGITSTTEGILDAAFGILTGVMVDHLESYKLPCLVYGLVSLIMGIVLIVLFKFFYPPPSVRAAK